MATGLICMMDAAMAAALAAAAPSVRTVIDAALRLRGPAPIAAATRGVSSQAGSQRRSPPQQLACTPLLGALGARGHAAISSQAAAGCCWEARRGCMTYHCIMYERQAVAPPAEVVQAVAAAAEEQVRAAGAGGGALPGWGRQRPRPERRDGLRGAVHRATPQQRSAVHLATPTQ